MIFRKIKQTLANILKRDASDAVFHKNPNSSADAIEFLPAALEILEKPPSPAGRLLGYSLMVLFTIAVFWAFIGKVDVVASAEGKIIPSGRVKLIQPMRMGVVENIYVKEGDLVEQGQALIELDQTLTAADRKRFESEIRFLNKNLVRALALKTLFDASDATSQISSSQFVLALDDHASGHLDPEQKALQLAMLKQSWLEYQSQLAILESQLTNKRSELEGTDASIAALTTTIPLISKRVAALQKLHDQGLGAEMQLLELREQQVTQQQSLVAEKARKKQVRAALAEVEQTRIAQENNARKLNLEEIENLRQQIHSSQQELEKANELYTNQVLLSPVKGRVKQLAVHTIGGVVEEAQVLMQIVPEESFLEVEAILQNKDIGFVHEGQKAEIKIHTFPFTKYGVVDAEVLGITADAIETEQQGLVYTVRLKMDQTKLRVDKKWIDLIPGMAVTAEVKTNKRKLIDFFLSPLLRYKDESVRER